MGSIQAGVIGFGINIINVIVGVFIATGQDVAAAIESSSGLFIVQPVTQEEMESRNLSNYYCLSVLSVLAFPSVYSSLYLEFIFIIFRSFHV